MHNSEFCLEHQIKFVFFVFISFLLQELQISTDEYRFFETIYPLH